MPTVQEILNSIETIAPHRYGFESDRIGLQVGDPQQSVTRAAVSLDRSLGAIEFAKENGCELLVSHHPLIFTPVTSVDTKTHVGRSILELAKNRIAFIASHTNWDSASPGLNDYLCGLIGLKSVRSFGSGATVKTFKLVSFCPATHTQTLIDALAEKGAGQIGAYRRCAFSQPGQGTFIGGEGTTPAVGSSGRVEVIDEVRIEMVFREGARNGLVAALRKAHPYEEAAFDIYPLAPFIEQPAGRIGELDAPTTLAEFAVTISRLLDTRVETWGDPEKRLRRIAVVGGAADGEWIGAQRANADVLLTGEVKQHVGVEAGESGMCLMAAGHYATEHPGAVALKIALERIHPEIDWLLFTPKAGMNGRPFYTVV